MSRLRFLLLENKPQDIEAIQAVLTAGKVDYELLDYALLTVGTRTDFVEALDQAFDVILAAYGLPDLDGMMALELAIDRCPDVPFIVFPLIWVRNWRSKRSNGVRPELMHFDQNLVV